MTKQQQLTIIGITLAAVASLLAQSATTTSHVMAETIHVKQEASKIASTNNTTTNNSNNSNAVLGNLFLTGQDRLTNFNPINKTYTKVSK